MIKLSLLLTRLNTRSKVALQGMRNSNILKQSFWLLPQWHGLARLFIMRARMLIIRMRITNLTVTIKTLTDKSMGKINIIKRFNSIMRRTKLIWIYKVNNRKINKRKLLSQRSLMINKIQKRRIKSSKMRSSKISKRIMKIKVKINHNFLPPHQNQSREK